MHSYRATVINTSIIPLELILSMEFMLLDGSSTRLISTPAGVLHQTHAVIYEYVYVCIMVFVLTCM